MNHNKHREISFIKKYMVDQSDLRLLNMQYTSLFLSVLNLQDYVIVCPIYTELFEIILKFLLLMPIASIAIIKYLKLKYIFVFVFLHYIIEYTIIANFLPDIVKQWHC